jgi:hypothetical protein
MLLVAADALYVENIGPPSYQIIVGSRVFSNRTTDQAFFIVTINALKRFVGGIAHNRFGIFVMMTIATFRTILIEMFFVWKSDWS